MKVLLVQENEEVEDITDLLELYLNCINDDSVLRYLLNMPKENSNETV